MRSNRSSETRSSSTATCLTTQQRVPGPQMGPEGSPVRRLSQPGRAIRMMTRRCRCCCGPAGRAVPRGNASRSPRRTSLSATAW